MVQEVANILKREVRMVVSQGGPETGTHGGELGLLTRQQPAGFVCVVNLRFKPTQGIDRQTQDPGTAISLKRDRPQARGAVYDQVGTPVTLNLAVQAILSAIGTSAPSSVMNAAKITVLVPSGKVIL
jgi:hypothetical protein